MAAIDRIPRFRCRHPTHMRSRVSQKKHASRNGVHSLQGINFSSDIFGDPVKINFLSDDSDDCRILPIR